MNRSNPLTDATMDSVGDAPPVARLLDLTGHTALVTGAGSGIGTGIALRFGEAGAAVVVHFHSSEGGARAVAARIREAGGRAVVVAGRSRQRARRGPPAGRRGRRPGDARLVVNNAGIYPLGTILDMAAGRLGSRGHGAI